MPRGVLNYPGTGDLLEWERGVLNRGRLGTQKGGESMWGQPAFYDRYGPGATPEQRKEAATQIAFGAMTAGGSNVAKALKQYYALKSDALASRSVYIYNPPARPQRPFDADYPTGARTDDAGRLTHDIDGNPLQVGGRIVGRRVAGGADEALPAAEFDAIAKEAVGFPAKTISPIQMRRRGDVGQVVVDGRTRRPVDIYLSNKLTSEQRPKVYGHEIGHVIDQLAGEIPTKGLSVELKGVYNTLNNPNRSRDGVEAATFGKPWTPGASGYKGNDVPREWMAEAIRAYMNNPSYLKTVAPKTAKAIRNAVNKNPEIRKIIQFNSIGGLGILGISEDENRHRDDIFHRDETE